MKINGSKIVNKVAVSSSAPFVVHISNPGAQLSVSEALDPNGSCPPDRAYPGFCSMKRLRSISTPPGRDANPSQGTPPHFVRFPQQFAGTPGWREVL